VGIVYDEEMTKHHDLEDDEHPEQPARITSIYGKLQEAGLVDRCVRFQSKKATREQLLLKHTAKHVDAMMKLESLSEADAIEQGHKYRSVYLGPESTQAALLSAGSVIEGVSAVCRGEAQRGICVVRPPGHHAECDCAMGFCMFANLSLAVAEVHRTGLSHRTLIVDWDIHHGNGTYKLFEDDPAVLFFSIHRYDNGRFFPGGPLGNYTTHGSKEGEGYSVHVPWDVRGGLKRGHPTPGDSEYIEAFDKLLLPIAADFQPDLVVVSAGFDAAKGDPLGLCNVSPRGYYELMQKLLTLANGRVVVVLEGGYNLESISVSMLACARALLGDEMPADEDDDDDDEEEEPVPRPPPHHFHADLIEKVRVHQAQFWPSLCREGEEVSQHAAGELRVPAAALKGTLAEMEAALREHATCEATLEGLRHRQENVLFKLDEVPPDPHHVEMQRGWQALRSAFELSDHSPPYLLVSIVVQNPDQVVRCLSVAMQSGATGAFLVNNGDAHSPEEAAMSTPGVQKATLKGPSGGAAGKAGKAQLEALAEAFAAARDAYPAAWIGLSVPQLPPSQVFKWIASHCPTANAAWIHGLTAKAADVEWEEVKNGDESEWKTVRVDKWYNDHQASLKGVLRERAIATWKGIVFGDVAVDGQTRVHHEQDAETMCEACQELLRHWTVIVSSVCDIVVTSKKDRTSLCSLAKLQAMGGVTPLALMNSGQVAEGEAVGGYRSAVDVSIVDGNALAAMGQKSQEAFAGSQFDLDREALVDWVARWKGKAEA